MRLLIAAVGKLKQGPERELCAHYLGRAEALGRNLGLSPISVVDLAESRVQDAPGRRSAEAEALLTKLPEDFAVICLDPRGALLSSEAFADELAARRDDAGAPGLAFVLGGPDGLGQGVIDRAGLSLSLGPMTLPHGLARVVLAEQIYRAMTILAGHPYHRA
ncbi:23S rRNA (pseudouridine(1915)-N(3))-methyltransferase RlmH [Methyloceanibacter methanicus]|uniref:Ribosomal RNA large subunit methyltransferase H n=1 Tax=Methyloceanibacter methanicus TaxID=1774968 RepID=A0A1E3W409_9HYPH|nr:23S rRNA (pseudouridine(1915)-N(3))-methyltransferase RlmH [Methyloceanibacter methanicus]ODS00533.1 23S rRNA (pseudouridine(1915)-N(3))-methyltransferase RlmH [Methyloceanibacter methanicus]